MSSLLFISSSSLLVILKNSKIILHRLCVGASGRTVVLSTSTGWFTSPQLLYQSGHCQLWPMKFTEDTGDLFFFDRLFCTHKHTHAQTKQSRGILNTHIQHRLSATLFIQFLHRSPLHKCPSFQTSLDCRRDGWRDGTEEGRGRSSRNKGEASICTPIVFPSL